MSYYAGRANRPAERDTQRRRVYKSDGALAPFSKPLKTVAEMERFVAKVWKSERVRAAWDKSVRRWSAPIVKDGRGRSRAGGHKHYVTMPLWSRTEGILLHEIAHTICGREYEFEKVEPAAHGWQYCAIYLRLTLYILGREAHDALKAAFKANRVRYTAPRKGRKLTPEQRAAAIARLSVYNGTAATDLPFWEEAM